MGRCFTLALAALLALAGRAEAGWPKPAAGRSSSGDPEVIFTFDDGPHERWTALILDTLAEHNVQAIFYWVGRRVERDRAIHRKRKALVARAIREGHLVGNHTVHHVHLCQGTPEEAAIEIDRNRSLFESISGFPLVLFRTPYGDRCKRLLAMLEERGLTHLHWDIDPREYLGFTAEDTAQFVIGKLRRLRGRAVILMHDTQPESARALPLILTWIEQENARRVRSGERPIRILGGPDLLVEQHQEPLWRWGRDAAGAARERLGRALFGLVPGAPAPGTLSLR